MPSPPVPDRTETLAPRPGGTSITVEDTVEAPARPADKADPRHAPPADDPERYEPVNEHARGGLGRVVRALDRRLGRTVAVKELLRHDPSNEARFLREAMITARLEHPGIVPVHEAGRWPNGDPYYVMKLVEGRTLKELIAERVTLRERLGLVPHVIAVADAVGYAHSESVIHRDLKPANVIVGSFGETIVVDWGLARDCKRDLPEPGDEILTATGPIVSTVSGKVVGTPAYMSPEQARGEVVDERADVYALGAVLYEVLAGAPPHADATPQAVLDRVIAGPPRPLTMLVPGVPGELATIVRKAMARDPGARYPNAIALAEDLRRFTTGKLVSAHAYSTWELLRKKLSRHRGVVAVAALSVLVLGAIGVASVRRVVAERNIARSQRGLAEEALSSAEKRKRELVLLQAGTALPRDPTAALAWLKTYDVGPGDRGKVVDVVDEALALGVARHVFRPGDWVFDAQFTPDGTTLVAAVRDGVIRAYDLGSGAETELGKAPSALQALVLSPDGELAITGGAQGEVIAWPLHGRSQVGGDFPPIGEGPAKPGRSFTTGDRTSRRAASDLQGGGRMLDPGTGRMVSRLRLSPDGRLLVDRSAGAPQVISLAGGEPELLGPPSGLLFAVADDDWSRVVMLTSANEVAVPERGQAGAARLLARTDKAIDSLAISPHGDTVLVHDGTTLWAVPFTRGALHELARYEGRLTSIVWSPDGRTIAVGGNRSEILLVDTATGKVSELRGHSDAIYTLAWSHDGTQLLSASDDATARLWRLANHSAIVLRGHDDDVDRARFSPDERSIATSSFDGSTRVWSIDRLGATPLVEGDPITSMRLDGDRVTVGTSTAFTRWDLVSGQRAPLFSWADEPHHPGSGIISDDDEHAVFRDADGSLELRARGGASIQLRGHRGLITQVGFAHDGRALFSSSSDGTLRRWDVATGAGTLLIQGTAPVRGFAVARDGRVVAYAGDLAYLIDAGGAVTRLGRGAAWCIGYAEFEPVTDRLVLHRCDTSLAIMDGTRVIELPTGGHMAGRVAVSPDGRRIASGMTDRTVRLWDAGTGQLIDILRGHSDAVRAVAFSPDGNELASASYDKTIRIWDLATQQHRVLRGHTASVDRVAWRGADQLVTGSPDGTIRLWHAPSLGLPSEAEIMKQLNAATTARIDRDRPVSGYRTARGT